MERCRRVYVQEVKALASAAEALLSPWPCIGEEEIEAAVEVLRSGQVNYWTGGKGRAFEAAFAEANGSAYAVAVANGSVALELALQALGLQPGDEVVTTSRTFIASVSSIALRGLRPVFADVDRDSQNLTAESISAVLTPRTRAIVAVHLAGWPCDMEGILNLAERHGLLVIEDCAQAQGARYKGRPVGSFGHAAAFSFCQDKVMTTAGEGGMLTTSDHAVWQRAWSYKDHGKDFDAVHSVSPEPGFRWVHTSLGTNWRMTEVQSAIGLVALRKVPEWLRQRRRNAAILTKCLEGEAALRVPQPPGEVDHAWYKYYVFVRPELLREGWTRDRILQGLAQRGIPAFTGSCSEVYLEEAVDPAFRPAARLRVARELGETSLMFPVHPTLSEEQMHRMGEAIRDVVRGASRGA